MRDRVHLYLNHELTVVVYDFGLGFKNHEITRYKPFSEERELSD